MKSSIAFVYGVVAYLVFLVAFLYAIGFIGNFIVPKSIDSGQETTLGQALLVNALLMGLFAVQHSVMARPAFKKWWTGIIGPVIERSTYVLLSSLALFLMYWKWQPIPTVVWNVENQAATLILNGLFFTGWLIVLLSTFMINHFDLFGLRQVFENLRNQELRQVEFKKSFFYKIVRHPIMLGFIIAFWSTPVMTLGHLVFSITTTLYIIVAVRFFEERDLKNIHGKAYEEYQKEVPMLIPFIKPGKG
jgi:methanethiol S-methyltransferase